MEEIPNQNGRKREGGKYRESRDIQVVLIWKGTKKWFNSWTEGQGEVTFKGGELFEYVCKLIAVNECSDFLKTGGASDCAGVCNCRLESLRGIGTFLPQ